MSERRQLKRYPASVPVWCESDDFTLFVHTINVSREGLFVRTSNPPPPQTAFTVVFEKLDVAAEVRVTWVRGRGRSARNGMGLEITRFERGKKSYERFIRAQEDQQPDRPGGMGRDEFD